MIHAKILKTMAEDVRAAIESGETKLALQHLEMIDRFADFQGYKHEYTTQAIQAIAQRLKLDEPEAAELLLMNGVKNAGRVLVLGGDVTDFLEAEAEAAHIHVLPALGLKSLTDAEISAISERRHDWRNKEAR